MSSQRFRVAFSFAGEKREFVAQVAAILAQRFGEGTILYDKYHEAEFARADLAFHLPKLYYEQADLIVPILCRDYETKEWTGLEWGAIYGVIKQRQCKEVMLCRFDQVEGVGLYGNAGFIELDHKTPAEVATLILQRLASNEDLPMDTYTRDLRDAPAHPDWPAAAPALDWQVAGHAGAKTKFETLITCASQSRLLSIYGPKGIGKEYLNTRFLAQAGRIPNLVSGRFNFGVANSKIPLRTLARNLKVETPSADKDLVDQLENVFDSLKKSAGPALLIFEGFESAGEAESWVTDGLLHALVGAPWLRVVITGRDKIERRDPWRDFSFPPVPLTPPTPEEWFKYGSKHKPDLTQEFVDKAYQYAGGDSHLLSGLLGPPP